MRGNRHFGATSGLVVAFAVIIGLLAALLSGQFQTALTDKIFEHIAVTLGQPEARVISAFNIWIVPVGAATCLVLAAYKVAFEYLSATKFREDPNGPILSLSRMSAKRCAVYLLNDSAWAYRLYRKVNFWSVVKESVWVEMQTAGARGDVRYIGTRANSSAEEEIPPSYFQVGFVDNDDLWGDGQRFTYAWDGFSSFEGGQAYFHGYAPRLHIEREWPRASWIVRLYSRAYVRCKIWWYWSRSAVRLICGKVGSAAAWVAVIAPHKIKLAAPRLLQRLLSIGRKTQQ